MSLRLLNQCSLKLKLAFINPLIAGSWRSAFREIEMSVEWTARTPPKRQVEGSNPSEPASILSIYLGPFCIITMKHVIHSYR